MNAIPDTPERYDFDLSRVILSAYDDMTEQERFTLVARAYKKTKSDKLRALMLSAYEHCHNELGESGA